jgi:hypothetical protein
MIGLSFTYHVYWRTTTTINPIIIRPHYVFTDRRQQRQPNNNTTTYCVYWRTTTTINPIIIRPHCMFTDRRQQRQPNHIICGRIMIGFIVVVVRQWTQSICGRILIGLSLSSVSKHNMWSYLLTEDIDNPIIIRPHIVFTFGRQQRQPNHNTTIYHVYWRKTTVIVVRQ